MRDYWEEPEAKSKKINAKKIILSIAISILVIAIIIIVALYITNNEFRNWIDVEIFRKELCLFLFLGDAITMESISLNQPNGLIGCKDRRWVCISHL